jgi:flavin-dependent dehydrogenase
MIGDTAGLIHPLCGNGMAMAIHSAKLATENTIFSRKRISRSTLENDYLNDWNRNLKNRLQAGRLLGKLLQHTAQAVFKILIIFLLYL